MAFKMVTTVSSLYAGLYPEPEVGSDAGITVDLEGLDEKSEAQLCAAELTHRLSAAIQADDQFSRRTWFNFDPTGNWRDPKSSASHVKLSVGCHPVQQSKGHAEIACRGSVGGISSVFARYWAFFPLPDTQQANAMSREHHKRLEDLRAYKKEHGDACLEVMLETAFGARLFSPYHPDCSHFSIPFRMQQQQYTARLVLVVPEQKASVWRSPLTYMVAEAPVLFHRLFSDIYRPFPEVCRRGMPAIVPTRVAEMGNVLNHFQQLGEYAAVYSGQRGPDRGFITAYDATNARTPDGFATEMPISRFRDRIIACARGVSKLTPFHRCDEGLPVWSGHPACPPTSACYDSVMCNRVMSCGNGLWLAVRGQHSLEDAGSTARSYIPLPANVLRSMSECTPPKLTYDYDETTKAFYDFAERRGIPYLNLEDDKVVHQKLHVKGPARSMFVVIFHQPSSDGTLGYQALDSLSSSWRTADAIETASAEQHLRKLVAGRPATPQKTQGSAYVRPHSVSSTDSDEKHVVVPMCQVNPLAGRPTNPTSLPALQQEISRPSTRPAQGQPYKSPMIFNSYVSDAEDSKK